MLDTPFFILAINANSMLILHASLTREGALFTIAKLLFWAFGTWRSLVAHLTGGQGVAGSNPVVPTSYIQKGQNLGF